jgi:hypothetical protein
MGLAPTTPYSSVKHGGFKYVGYTGVFNVVDYAAVSFPCGVTADMQRDRPIANHSPLSPDCKVVHEECKRIRFTTWKVYVDPEQMMLKWCTVCPLVFSKLASLLYLCK